MNKIVNKKHNLVGVASTIIGIMNLSYVGILGYDYNEGKIFLNKWVNWGPGAIMGLVTIPLLFIIIPTIGHTIGIILGIVGVFQFNSYKRLYVILGLFLNTIILLISLITFLLLVISN